MSADEKELGRLKRKLKALLATLDKLIVFISAYDSGVNNVNQIRVRLEELVTMDNKFENYQSEIEILEVEHEDVRIMVRTNFTERLCDIKASLMQLLDQEVKKVNEVASPYIAVCLTPKREI